MSSSHGTSVCIDAGSQFCPCVLADLGECITCSLLKGEDLCNCTWSGVCVYSEWVWAGRRPLPPRPEYELPLLDINNGSKSLAVFTVNLPDNLARDVSDPGTFLFLRPPGTRQCFNTPVSIMDVTGRKAKFSVQLIGPKTKALARSSGVLLARGPYWNGVFGVQRLRHLRNSRALIVAKGIGQGPALHIARRLLAQGNSVTVAVAPSESIGIVFIEKELGELGVALVRLGGDNGRASQLLAGMLHEFDLVHSSGPDAQHRLLMRLIRAASPRPKFTASNNSVMCCGDGVCGGCGISTRTNHWTRACKASVNPEEVYLLNEGEALV
ncbi:MAG: hypothetical protein ACM3X4_08475 [Ignavibacteriales bacterium]